MSKLRLSLVETRRVGGRVKQEHVASLGSLPQAMTVGDRQEFWRRLEPRLEALGNRIDLDAARALIAAQAPPPSKIEIDILDLERYAEAWRQMADFFGPQEFEQTPFEAAMSKMSAAVKAKEHSNAMARVAKARERIEHVRKGEDAGLKAPFDPHNNPVYRAAVANMARVAKGLSLIDEDRLREILMSPEVIADAGETSEGGSVGGGAREGRRAARKGWGRYDEFFEEQRYWRGEARGR